MDEESNSSDIENGSVSEAEPCENSRAVIIFRTISATAGLVAAVLGVVSLLSSYKVCYLLSMYQIVVGVCVATIESNFCYCAGKIDQMPWLPKAVVYILAPLLPIFTCFSLNTLLGCIWVVLVGVCYGVGDLLQRFGNRVPI